VRELGRKSYYANREKRCAASRRWRIDNPDKKQAMEKKWYAANPEYAKGKNLMRRYGIDIATAAALKAAGCGVCSGPATAIDHCHASGHVRGAVCARCNLFLGIIEKAGDGLYDQAVAYLAKGAK
jgi:hypothetical protein